MDSCAAFPLVTRWLGRIVTLPGEISSCRQSRRTPHRGASSMNGTSVLLTSARAGGRSKKREGAARDGGERRPIPEVESDRLDIVTEDRATPCGVTVGGAYVEMFGPGARD